MFNSKKVKDLERRVIYLEEMYRKVLNDDFWQRNETIYRETIESRKFLTEFVKAMNNLQLRSKNE